MKNENMIYCVECEKVIGLRSNYWGHKKKCDDCLKQRVIEYRKKRRLWMKEYQKKWYQKNLKKIHDYNLEYRLIGERLREQGIQI